MNRYNQGLIKEALLISIAIFLLVQAGFEPALLLDNDWWQNTWDEFWQWLSKLLNRL